MTAVSGSTPDEPVAIVACGGPFPFAVAQTLRARGSEPVIFAIEGVTDPVLLKNYRHHRLPIGKFATLIKLLRAEHCRDVILIGSLIRPSLRDMRFDWGAVRLIPEIAAALRGGDDHLLTRVARLFEREGFRLVGVPDIAPELLMPEGLLTQMPAEESALADIAFGSDVLRALGPFDIGQAVVVIDRHVIGVEGIEGTDALLARVAQLRAEGRLRKKVGRGVLVKGPKTGQDARLDLPTIGSATVACVARAQLSGIAVTSGQAVVADAQAMIEAADRARLFILGQRQ